MTFYLDIPENKQYIIHVAIGEATIEEATQSYKDSLEREEFRPGMNSIWDLTSGSFENLSPELFHSMIDAVSKTNHLRGKGHKVAVVVNDRDHLKLGLKYEEMAQGILPHNMQVFLKMSEALVWLKEKTE